MFIISYISRRLEFLLANLTFMYEKLEWKVFKNIYVQIFDNWRNNLFGTNVMAIPNNLKFDKISVFTKQEHNTI